MASARSLETTRTPSTPSATRIANACSVSTTTPQTTLSPAQILALLNKVFVLRVARAQETLAIPQEEPVARRTWSAKPWQLALGAVVLLLVLWLLL